MRRDGARRRPDGPTMNQVAADGWPPPVQERGSDPPTILGEHHESRAVTDANLPTDSLIGIGEIRAIFGLGRTAAYELTHRPDFPAPICLSSRCYRWWAAEVTAFAGSLRQQTRPANRQRSRHPATRSDHTPMPTPRISGRVRMTRRRNESS
jgi:predicted DNA-binding transcriptional regulator AlpA